MKKPKKPSYRTIRAVVEIKVDSPEHTEEGLVYSLKQRLLRRNIEEPIEASYKPKIKSFSRVAILKKDFWNLLDKAWAKEYDLEHNTSTFGDRS